MIIKGRSRSNGIQLANYLLHSEANEHVCVLEVSGMASDKLPDALREMQEITDSGQKGVKGLYHGVISPQPGYELTREHWIIAADELGRALKLEHQPRAIVIHEKQGRAHAHVVFQRTDRETLTLIPDSWNYVAHEKASRALEREWGHEIVPGAHVEPKAKDRERSSQADHDRLQAARSKMSRAERVEQVTGLYQQSDSARSFASALRHSGYALACGDRRDYVIVDSDGEAYALARYIKGVKTKQLRAFMESHDMASLPDVAQARQHLAERALIAERKGAAKEAFDQKADASNREQPREKMKGEPGRAMAEASPASGWTRYSTALAGRVQQSRHIVRSMCETLAERLTILSKSAAEKFSQWRDRLRGKDGSQARNAPALKDQFTEAVRSKARKAVRKSQRVRGEGPEHER